MPEPLAAAIDELRGLLTDRDTLVRAVASGRRRGQAPPWRRVELRPVRLRLGHRLQIVTYDERTAHTRNLEYGDAPGEIDGLLALPFGTWRVETVTGSIQLRITKKGEAQVHRDRTPRPPADGAHDRTKPRLLDPAEPVLHEVGITTADGRVKARHQDKLRQIEEFLRLLDPLLDELSPGAGPVRVVDLGCGNAYLTFAAYRFLTMRTDRPVALIGVDVRGDAREKGTAIAARLGFDNVRFVTGTILDAPLDASPEAPDVVLALHACDTATDEALARAVRWRSPLVLAAPCCHHDLQRQLPAVNEAPAPYGTLLRHGILRERFADVLTDALRAAILRLLGYRVEVVEFVASRHTPRNTLLRAVRTSAKPGRELIDDYRTLTRTWQVRPALARLLAPELSAAVAELS